MSKIRFTPKKPTDVNTQVWKKKGKLFVRLPITGEDDYPLQIEIDIQNKTYDIYAFDIYRTN